VWQALNGRRNDWVDELLTLFNSRVLSRIVNRMAFTIAWAIAVTTIIAIGERYPESGLGWFTDFEIPGWPHELVGGFLSILLVFRTDQAYERYWEGRRQWSEVSTACRDLARVAMSNLKGPMVDELMAHVSVFPVALKQHLRGTQNREEMAAVFNTYLEANSSYIDMVTQSKSMPTTVLLSTSNVISALRRAPRARQLDLVWQEMENKIDRLSDIVAECEKIKCSYFLFYLLLIAKRSCARRSHCHTPLTRSMSLLTRSRSLLTRSRSLLTRSRSLLTL
jgi:predicted membrane chloride channel (bestrophin family)